MQRIHALTRTTQAVVHDYREIGGLGPERTERQPCSVHQLPSSTRSCFTSILLSSSLSSSSKLMESSSSSCSMRSTTNCELDTWLTMTHTVMKQHYSQQSAVTGTGTSTAIRWWKTQNANDIFLMQVRLSHEKPCHISRSSLLALADKFLLSLRNETGSKM